MPRIGIYVHHHGGGHASRCGAIGAALRARGAAVTYLTSLDPARLDGEVVALPLDVDPAVAVPGGSSATTDSARCSICPDTGHTEQRGMAEKEPAELHFAPVGSPGLRRRMARIAAWIADAAPDLLLVDVSVEVALLARLCGTRFAYVRQTGRREDPPHRLAYGWAAGLLAPYPEWLEADWAPAELRERTGYVGAVTRFDGAPRPEMAARPRRALVLGDGAERIGATLAAAAPDWDVLVAAGGGARAAGVDPAATAIDPAAVDLDLLASCALVVSPAGANTVAEAAFAGCGLVCIPRRRPFDEQVARGEDLERDGAAVVRAAPPEHDEWPAVLEAALDRRPALVRWADGGGAARAAAYLEALATGSSRSRPASQRTSPAAASSSNHPGAGQVPQISR